MTESEFQSQVIKEGEKHGWKIHHIYDSRRATATGFPDLALMREDFFAIVELKVGSKKPDWEQKEWLNSLDRWGTVHARAFFWHPRMWADIKKFFVNPMHQPGSFFSWR